MEETPTQRHPTQQTTLASQCGTILARCLEEMQPAMVSNCLGVWVWVCSEECLARHSYAHFLLWHPTFAVVLFVVCRFFPLPNQYRDPESITGFCFRDVPRLRTAAEMEMV